jgi:Domain of unknown function (DUF6458)
MAPRILLVVLGAIFAFAVRVDTKVIDLQVMGWILMVGGAALIYQARQTGGRVHETTVVDDHTDSDRPVYSVREYYSDDQPVDRPADPVDAPTEELGPRRGSAARSEWSPTSQDSAS